MNKVNGKIYIGQTKEFYGDGSTKAPYGINVRLNKHLNNAFSKSKKTNTACPLLYNAIRKYGKDKFHIEELCKCKLEERDEKEKFYIKTFNSTDNKKGYNISEGGNGGESNIVRDETSEIVREKISKSQTNTQMNIKPYYRNDVLVGYMACRRQNGKLYKKIYSSTKFSPEQNKQKAVEYITYIKNHKNEKIYSKYNRSDNLPTNIIYRKNKSGVAVGFEVCIQKNGIKYVKTFANSKNSMEEKLQLAIKYKNSVINS